jgi:alpha-tubulin suppressor-like RCC1 family protein
LSQGAKFGPPFFHAEGFVPDLFVEQSVELVRSPNPAILSCVQTPGEPPVLSNGSLQLRNYRPYVPEGANIYEPDLSGTLKLWTPSDPWILRSSGELINAGDNGLSNFEMSLVPLKADGSLDGTGFVPPFSSLPAATVVAKNDRLWFEEMFLITTDNLVSRTFSHQISFVENGTSKIISRRIPLDVSPSLAPVSVEGLNLTGTTVSPLLGAVGGTDNLFAIKVTPGSQAALLPLRSNSVFPSPSSTGVIEVVPEPTGMLGVNLSGNSPECPLEMRGASVSTSDAAPCTVYFAVFNKDSLNATLELQVAGPPDSSGQREFRLAQFKLPSLDSPALDPAILPVNLAARPALISGGYIELGSSVGLVNPVVISSEISGEGFYQKFLGADPVTFVSANGKYQVPNYWPLGSSTPQNCVKNVSVLIMTGSDGERGYRRETFRLPDCQGGTPVLSAPNNLSAAINSSSAAVTLSWGPPSVGNSGITYDLYRNGSVIQPNSSSLAFTDSAVNPGELYSYFVVAKNGTLSSLPSNSVIVTPIGPFAIDPILVSNESGPNALRVQWSEAAGASTYEVKYRLCPAPNACSDSWSSAGTSAAQPRMITGLSAESTYQVKVVASNGATGGVAAVRESPMVEGVPLVRPVVNAVPNSTSILFNFSNVIGSGTIHLKYGTQAADSSGNYEFSQTVPSGSSASLSGLNPGQTYYGVLRAENSSGYLDSLQWTVTLPPTPQALRFLGVTEIAAGNQHTCAIRKVSGVGSVWCWGDNSYGQLGVSSISELAPSTTVPQQVSLPSGEVLQIAVGGYHSCALIRPNPSNGTQPPDEIWCWGRGEYGQLGNGGSVSSSIPVSVSPVAGVNTIAKIVAGSLHTCALYLDPVFSENRAYCWGGNSYGQLGNGTLSNRSIPDAVNFAGIPGLITEIFTGPSHACAIRGGALVCWGRNDSYQMLMGSASLYPLPQVVVTVSSGISILSGGAGVGHTCSLAQSSMSSLNRSLQCWGQNSSFQAGQSSLAYVTAPFAVSALLNPREVTAGDEHTCVLDEVQVSPLRHSVKCWGSNSSGQLGNGVSPLPGSSVVNPALVLGIPSQFDVTKVTAGASHTCAIVREIPNSDEGNSVKCWGSNSHGQLGKIVVSSSISSSAVEVSLEAGIGEVQ